MPSREEIEAKVHEFNDRGITQHDMAYIDGALSDDFVEHSPLPGLGNDKKSAVQGFEMLFAGTPDFRGEILDVVIGGNKAAIRGRYSGTDSGTGQMPGLSPTGKPYTAEAIDVVTVGDDGRFTEHYGIFDVTAVMMQLGLMPGGPPDHG
jgi:predicted ester cyclase